MASVKLVEAQPASRSVKLMWEKELLGLYISGHPLDKYREILLKRELNIEKLKEIGKEAGEELRVELEKAKKEKAG